MLVQAWLDGLDRGVSQVVLESVLLPWGDELAHSVGGDGRRVVNRTVRFRSLLGASFRSTC